MPKPEILATIASIVTAAGAVWLAFRIEREIALQDEARRKRSTVTNWVAAADWLVIGATLTASVVVLLPMLLASDSELVGQRIPAAGSAAAVTALAGYPFALLAHYRLVFGTGRSGPRRNPEPAEKVVIVISTTAAVVLFAVSIAVTG